LIGLDSDLTFDFNRGFDTHSFPWSCGTEFVDGTLTVAVVKNPAYIFSGDGVITIEIV